MRALFRVAIVILYVASISMAMFIPEDTEILDGYIMDDPVDEISPEDLYFEVRSLTGHAMRPIRNKREAKYEVLQSTGLASHFLPKGTFRPSQSGTPVGSIRRARSVETKQATPPSATTKSNGADIEINEELPTAQKQTMENQRYAPDQNVYASDMVDRWTTAPFEYTKLERQNDEISMSESTAVNEGLKSRTPRVHFVTQQKKQAEAKSTIMADLNVASANKADSYQNARNERIEADSRYYQASAPTRYQDYDTYNRRYDR